MPGPGSYNHQNNSPAKAFLIRETSYDRFGDLKDSSPQALRKKSSSVADFRESQYYKKADVSVLGGKSSRRVTSVFESKTRRYEAGQ